MAWATLVVSCVYAWFSHADFREIGYDYFLGSDRLASVRPSGNEGRTPKVSWPFLSRVFFFKGRCGGHSLILTTRRGLAYYYTRSGRFLCALFTEVAETWSCVVTLFYWERSHVGYLFTISVGTLYFTLYRFTWLSRHPHVLREDTPPTMLSSHGQ